MKKNELNSEEIKTLKRKIELKEQHMHLISAEIENLWREIRRIEKEMEE